ncbi:ParB/RepB/Spo0J family partition protein [Tanticharoenia sakaeratensis]|jgi:ParB family transcriptional regulator, chromosome partitioning protein|uniref:Chromosome partitioning protein parB n=1 Tax=Tanticharoenia sakaeratensis NBRC 103193 TaxID=1231623 RepID=A0A0D6MPL9_9PROT|nr:ParB/RepB/Spo0J family partition protein [Tanticharoenia sakaeratensis]GAN55376.1 chromosome partitioning protein parB [Tanticharoenia sakaeratensis NBRC 103193]GBQ16557.1 chromosome partitioning protein ParB [Tanticharoenia sakaeratensis NBRC 103193]
MAKKDAPQRLGRGLAALLGDQAPTLNRVSRSTGAVEAPRPVTLPVDVLLPGSFQPRQGMQQEALEELADSIRSRGVLQPILVRPHPAQENLFQIIAGERRWRASQLAGLHEVPVHVRVLDDGDAMAAALVENLQRADLDAIEEAEGLHRLIDDYGLTQEELAGAVGKSRPHVANMLRLLALPDQVRAHVRSGALTAGHARALLVHDDPVAAAAEVIAKKLNVRQTEALAKRKPREASRPVPKDAEIAALERELSGRLGLRVQIAFDGKGGSIRIDYRSLDQFDSVLAKLRS